MESTGFLPEVAAKIAAMGPNFNNDVLVATRELYAPLVKKQNAQGVEVFADVDYGPDARHKLDIYRPPERASAIVVYIPGGGFVGGDKAADGCFYANLGTYFARHGILTLIANYRLAPKHTWPAGAQDVGRAVAWTRANAESYGGDSRNIFLWGQSAGASHVASYLFDSGFHPAEGVGVTAGILMSGVYRVAGPNPGPNAKAYYGDNEREYEARSPISHVAKSRLPLLLSVAEYDPPNLAAPSFELARAVTLRDGRSPQFAWQRGHNHVSTVMSIGSGQDGVGGRVRDFIASF